MFATILLVCSWISSGDFAREHVHAPLARFLVRLVSAVLSPLGTVSADGANLYFRGFDIEIVEACDGVLPTFIYLAAVLAFPSGWRSKLWGAALGVPAIFAINLLRLMSLVVVGVWRPDLFERVHIYVWQTLVIALSMALWVFWVERFVPEARAAHS